MTLPRQWFLSANIPKPIATEREIPRVWNREGRPTPHEKLGKTSDEQRKWIREQVKAFEKASYTLSPYTTISYHRKMANLDRSRDENGTINVAAMGKTRGSFYANRAAIINVAAARARAALTELNHADRKLQTAKQYNQPVDVAEASHAKERAWCELLIAGNDLACHPVGKAGAYVVAQAEYLEKNKEYANVPSPIRDLLHSKPSSPAQGAWKTAVQTGQISPSKSSSHAKRCSTNLIQRQYPDWRRQAFLAVAKKWKLWTAVASVTGCRSDEIAGIKFYRDKSDPTFLMFEIKGAKVNKAKGHGIEFRMFSVRESGCSAFDYLMEHTGSDPFVVPDITKDDGGPLSDINAAFRNAINNAGRKFIKQVRNAPTLSPYCFRHAFACDIKATYESRKTLAIALGHATTKTQQMYGRANDGQRGKRDLRIDETGYKINDRKQSPLIELATQIKRSVVAGERHNTQSKTYMRRGRKPIYPAFPEV